MNTIVSIAVAFLVFGMVIFIHELGHLLCAKWCNIRVNEFAIGMGPTLVKFGKGETQYSLRLFPIGGFVSMEGEEETSNDPRSFRNAAIPKRLLVMVGGVFMNMLLGLISLFLLVAVSGTIATTTVNSFFENALTQKSGLQVGDTIIRVNGRRTFIMSDVFYELTRSENGMADLQVRRDGQKVFLPDIKFQVIPTIDPDTGETFNQIEQDFYVVGLPVTFSTVVKQAIQTLFSYTKLIYQTLFDLIAGRAPLNQLTGPIGIVSTISDVLSYGWRMVLNLLALISINLGVVNLLPVPALDGSKVLLLLLEGVRRRPLTEKMETAINLLGFVFLMTLMVIISFQDILRLFE